ncbi:MAG TPA: CDP-alcohol phosphatidyltransferase family protein [Euzebyales bacterium]|nr:CDP-alcohol phosphatidyltransferase family protein [Euzebyales bacterium]
MRSSPPSVAELRAVSQPAELVGRRSAEHWAGRLYMRRVSAHVTRRVLGLPVTPNGWTVLMIVVGVAGAAVLAVPGLWTAIAAAAAIQVYLLLDCVDGEVARWRRTTSAAGVYLDRLGHYTVEAALLAALGVRVDGGYAAIGLGTVVGLATAVLALLSKVETDLVVVARVSAGLPVDAERDAAPGTSTLRGVRRVFAAVPIHRIIGGVELSLLAVVAAVVDVATGEAVGSRALLAVATVAAAIVAVGHPIAILSSQRLR